MKKLKKLVSVLLLCLLLLNCQKDDICPESTAVTPLLKIEFNDLEDETRLKAVQDLQVKAVSVEDSLFGPVTANEISIPLRTDESITTYEFVRNSGTDLANRDTISFFYNPSPEYLNRACGFIVNYLGIQVEVVDDGDNWILSEFVQRTDVENELESEEAHIILTH